MKLTSKKAKSLLALAGMVLVSATAQAVTTYTADDLVIGFRQAGNANSLLVNLGQAFNYRDTTAGFTPISGLTGLGADLASAFGSDWYTTQSGGAITWGVVGAVGASAVSGGLVTDGARTLYGTRAETTFGTQSTAYNRQSTSLQSTPSTAIQTMGSVFAGQTLSGGYNVGLLQANSTSNSWNSYLSTTQFGYNGIWNLEGTLSSGSALDLFRMATGSGSGSYEGTFTIASDGAVSFGASPPGSVPEPGRFAFLGLGLGGLMLRRRRRC